MRKPWLLCVSMRCSCLSVCVRRVNADQQKTFSVLGYKIDTIVAWEDDGRTLVSTMTTTAARTTC